VFTIRPVVQKKRSYFMFGMKDFQISAKFPTILAETFHGLTRKVPGQYPETNHNGVLTHFFR
jgi:hypothetical protein